MTSRPGKTTSLSGLDERELTLLLDSVDALVSNLESDSELDELGARGEPYDWNDIARIRERILAARRRVR
jgi:hypothetical protein